MQAGAIQIFPGQMAPPIASSSGKWAWSVGLADCAALIEAGADPPQPDNYGRGSIEVASSEELRQQLQRAERAHE